MRFSNQINQLRTRIGLGKIKNTVNEY